jgi:hypothetical protein
MRFRPEEAGKNGTGSDDVDDVDDVDAKFDESCDDGDAESKLSETDEVAKLETDAAFNDMPTGAVRDGSESELDDEEEGKKDDAKVVDVIIDASNNDDEFEAET